MPRGNNCQEQQSNDFVVDPNISLNGVLKGCLDCGVAVTDSRGNLTFLNTPGHVLLGLAPGADPASSDLPSCLQQCIRSVLEGGNSSISTEVSVSSSDGTERVLTVDAARLPRDARGEGVLLTFWGLREEGTLEGKVRHFERLARLGVMSAGLAHELRNSMVALNTMTDLLLEQQPSNELAKTVRHELDRANSLAVRMLNYAKPASPSRKPISTHQVLDRALQLASSRFKAAGATVSTSLQADPDVVAADEAHMEQMFLNLLINAADAIDADGDVRLSTETHREVDERQTVRIAVRDSGPGIAPEILPNLFQPFYTTKRHGTGLGLYLAQRIINEHSGTIQVDSAPGQGTCVQVTLPVHAG